MERLIESSNRDHANTAAPRPHTLLTHAHSEIKQVHAHTPRLDAISALGLDKREKVSEITRLAIFQYACIFG
jgi:hypothetical protein